MVGVAPAGMRGRAAGIGLVGGRALGTRHRARWDEGAHGGPFVVPLPVRWVLDACCMRPLCLARLAWWGVTPVGMEGGRSVLESVW